MPNFDRTGPEGRGPTGGLRGNCRPQRPAIDTDDNLTSATPVGGGRGNRSSRGRGRGGMAPGQGRGRGRGGTR
ncbi:MAG: DUF5320 domain-containing protein [Desulfopila sp.]